MVTLITTVFWLKYYAFFVIIMTRRDFVILNKQINQNKNYVKELS